MLGLRDQPVFQSIVGVYYVGIADAQRELEPAARILVRDVIIAFGRRAVALTPLRAGWTRAERDPIGLGQLLLPAIRDVKIKLALGFLDKYAVTGVSGGAPPRLIALLSVGWLIWDHDRQAHKED